MKLSFRSFEAAASLKACHPLSKHLNMYHSVRSAFHLLDAQARCLPSLPKLLPEAQFEIIKIVEVSADCLEKSPCITLAFSLYLPCWSRQPAVCFQLSAQIQIISFLLSANSRHVTVNTTLQPSCSTHSLAWVWHESNDGRHQLHENQVFQMQSWSPSANITLYISEWQEKIASIVFYDCISWK